MDDVRKAARYVRRRATRPFGLLVGLTVVLVLGVAFDVSPYLRGPDSWRWAYALPGVPWRHAVPVLVVAAYVAGALVLLRRDGRTPATKTVVALLVLAALGAPLIQAALLFPDAPDVLRPLFYRTISPGASGFFTVGSRVEDPGAFLRAFPSLLPTFPVHPQRYPPGLPLAFFLSRQLFQRFPQLATSVGWALRRYQCDNLALMSLPDATIATATLQMALPAIMGLIVAPLYTLARTVADRRTALWAVILYPLIPSFALWSGRWDQAYPLLTCLAWALFMIGLRRRRPLWLAGAGFVLGIATFFSFGLVVMLMPLGLSGLFHFIGHRDQRRELLLGAAIFTLALVLPWALYRLGVGNGFVDIWRVAMGYHLGLNRDYGVWLFYHLYDFGLFLGVPVAVCLIWGIAQALSALRRSSDVGLVTGDAGAAPGGVRLGSVGARLALSRASLALPDAFTLAYGAALLLLDLSGVARGEVARVWLFLTPFAVVVAARVLARRSPAQARAAQILLAIQLLVFNAVLRVVTTGVIDPPQRARTFELPPAIQPVEAVFVDDGADRVALRGYALTPPAPRPGQTLELTLYWQALDRVSASYTVFNHLRVPAPDGTLLSQHDGLPQAGLAPTTCWLPGEVVSDSHHLALPLHAPAGTYELVTGLYRYDTGQRLAVPGPAAGPDQAVKLTDIVLPPSDR